MTLKEDCKYFYVTAKDGRRGGFATGPYPTAEAAKDDVERVSRWANENLKDPYTPWMAWGVTGTVQQVPAGMVKLNALIGGFGGE
ncbi:hypothetical protein [Segniliparus rugosus]|uniref:Uncharacterized protein n=1 Tax=Segniliparus rugosus (strain ATCC BAA-974 / DSM 45345 / CCUG 50838 / CIP 108380 / JCM 13579 / CDC 945) TaxID=679197 RepID=E5XRU6_SEGRC|nr:hypothetical protein [Segniliparus rugosus]EFV12961.1 hypothetical protein HMPREF9336_02218 [Segniliparus rugosus ATCC BAA-974]